MEILVLLKPEEFASIHWADAEERTTYPDVLLVEHASDEDGAPIAASALLVRGRGVTESVIALLRRRSEVAEIRQTSGALIIELKGDVDTAPLVSLLVESGVEIEEVHRREKRFEELLNRLIATGK